VGARKVVGTVIDHFRLVERLGGGGMGTVYKAVDLLLEREVALKCLRAELPASPS
jgi:serine/threonine-protein kinase